MCFSYHKSWIQWSKECDIAPTISNKAVFWFEWSGEKNNQILLSKTDTVRNYSHTLMQHVFVPNCACIGRMGVSQKHHDLYTWEKEYNWLDNMHHLCMDRRLCFQRLVSFPLRDEDVLTIILLPHLHHCFCCKTWY